MASEHPWIAPRLEGWAAAADVYGFPAGPSRANLFDAARHLHEVIHGRTKTGRIHDMDPALLMPEEFRG